MIRSTNDNNLQMSDPSANVKVPSQRFERDQSTDSIYATLMNRIHTSSAVKGLDDQHTLLVGLTSCDRGEGVTTVATNLARFSADVLQLKTLMIDASFGERHFESIHGMDSAADVGLHQVLAGSEYLSNAIQASPVHRLDYLPSGIDLAVESGTDMMLSTGFAAKVNTLKSQLDHRYQLVIVDLPPAGGLGTGTPIAGQMDAVILVVRPGKTRKEQASAVSGYLSQLGVNVIGAVANQAETQLPSGKELLTELVQIAREGAAIPFNLYRAATNQWQRFKNR